MEILKLRTRNGGFTGGPHPTFEAWIDLVDGDGLAATEVPRQVRRRLAAWSDGLEPGSPARVIGQLALALQRMAGANVSAETLDTHATRHEGVMVVEFESCSEEFARAALEAAIGLYLAARDEQPFPITRALACLRALKSQNLALSGC